MHHRCRKHLRGSHLAAKLPETFFFIADSYTIHKNYSDHHPVLTPSNNQTSYKCCLAYSFSLMKVKKMTMHLTQSDHLQDNTYLSLMDMIGETVRAVWRG